MRAAASEMTGDSPCTPSKCDEREHGVTGEPNDYTTLGAQPTGAYEHFELPANGLRCAGGGGAVAREKDVRALRVHLDPIVRGQAWPACWLVSEVWQHYTWLRFRTHRRYWSNRPYVMALMSGYKKVPCSDAVSAIAALW